MGDDERPDAPSLEAPTLGRLFGRRKDRASEEVAEDPAVPEAPVPDAPADWAPVEQPVPVAEPVAEPVTEPVAAVEETAVIEPTPAAPPVPVAPPAPVTAPAPTPAPAPAPAPQPAYAEERVARAPRPTLTVSGRVAAGATGAVIGLLVVALTAGSLELCESVRGVSSCGGGPGFLLLVAVTGAMVALGGLMLRLARVPDPTSTSFLAVGLLCVLALLFLIEVLDEWWMVIVIPAISTVTFLLSHWVTTNVVDADA